MCSVYKTTPYGALYVLKISKISKCRRGSQKSKMICRGLPPIKKSNAIQSI